MKVLFLTNIPSPYMVDFLNEFGKLCELTVIFERENSGVRDASWNKWKADNFTGIILKGIPVKVNEDLDDQAFCPQIVKYINKSYDRIIVANPCTPTGIIAILYMKLRKISYGIQSEGGFPKDGKGMKEALKKSIMGKATFYLSTADMGDRYFITYGADASRIFRYPFASLYEREVLDSPVSLEEKKLIREELCIPYEKVLLSIGRYIPVKGFDVLMEAFQGMDDSVGMYIIGGKPTDEYLGLKERYGLKHLHFVDFLDKSEIKKYYMASDIYLFNSRGDTWGLVINEAMAFGLPIVSSDQCYAALALIEDDRNGYIVPVDNVKEFKEKIIYLMKHLEVCEKMQKNNLEKAKEYTMEEMAKRVTAVLEEAYARKSEK